MRVRLIAATCSLVLTAILTTAPVGAQQAPHGHSMAHAGSGVPVLAGQDAFGAIQEIVRILETDPTTDWSRVNLERLRQHLTDMNEVTLRAVVKAEHVSGGLRMDITGTGRTERAIRDIPGGVRLTVVAKDPADVKTIARICGLGFMGLPVQGAHHRPHHLAMARGEAMAGHGH